MTIAAGFMCLDGIVLAVDSQYTGGIGKNSGQKIFPLWQKRYYSVTLASAGSVAMAKRAVETFKALVDERIGDRNTTLDELRETLEDALCTVHAKHIYPAPADERPVVDFWLLMAAWTPGGFELFRSDVTAVTPVEANACIGIGSYLGNYLAELLCHRGPLRHVEDIKPIAAHIISCAKGYVDGCGLNTFVRVLTDRGIDERIGKDEITDAEEFFESIFRSLRLCVEGAVNIAYPDVPQSAEMLSHSLRLFAEEFRKKQLKRHELKDKRRVELERMERERIERAIRNANPEVEPSPPSPTVDPSPQPPSLESPGGSGES